MHTDLLLFLDFDGVLHSAGSDSAQRFTCLPRFESVMHEYPGCKIVISSTWQEVYSLSVLRSRFSPHIAARIVGTTLSADPDREAVDRYEEIQRYLRKARAHNVPWVAVDDARHQFPSECAQLVLCDSFKAFDENAAQRLRLHLNRHLTRERKLETA